ncbi:MAG: hypothetical protein PHI63_00350 [Patescibacteria group bacterium]|nr:hypothetical protein [Patescibacteria group bacterium]
MRRTVDYARKRYLSPSNSRLRRGKKVRVGRFLQAIVFAAVLLGIANFGPIVSRLPLAEVKIEGLKLIESSKVIDVVRQQMEARRWLVLPQRLSVFFNVREARDRLVSEFPFANWFVEKTLLGGVSVAVQERTPVLVWNGGGNLFYLDNQGIAFAEVSSDQVSMVSTGATTIIRHKVGAEQTPVVTDESNRELHLGDQPATAEVLGAIEAVVHAMQEGIVPLMPTITGYRLEPSTGKLTLETSAGYVIYLDLASSLDEQLGKLTSVLGQGIGKRTGLRYIDVRYGQKVFYQ